jgi:diguanylate cyclase with GGDEF domain/PucR-like helix-turn-helix protein
MGEDKTFIELEKRYSEILAKAAELNAEPTPAEVEACRSLARSCADHGIPLHQVILDCHAATTNVWSRFAEDGKHSAGGAPLTAGWARASASILKSTSDKLLSAIVAGYGNVGRIVPDQDVKWRARFVEDLLAGRLTLADLVERAGRAGLDLSASYSVVVCGNGHAGRIAWVVKHLEDRLTVRFGSRNFLVGECADRVVALIPMTSTDEVKASRTAATTVVQALRASQQGPHRPWFAGAGRPRPGILGIRASYQEALEVLEVAKSTGVEALDPYSPGFLLHWFFTRDRPGITELIRVVLMPLSQAKHGAEPLLDTLKAYFSTGCMTTKAAEALHLSVRAVTYRLERIRVLTHLSVNVPEERFVLEAALRGARILGWPHNRFWRTDA